MATAKISKKAINQDEFIEGVFDFGQWLEAHWQRVAMGLGAVIAVVLLLILWGSMRERAAEEANSLLAKGMDAYSPPVGQAPQAPAPKYAEALPLFEQAEKSGSGRLADVAKLFHARTLIALNRPAEAVPLLEGMTGNRHPGLAGEAKVSLAEAVEATGNAERAATLLQELAAPAEDATYPADAALLLLGNLRERQGKKVDAKRVYDDLIAKFPQSPFAAEAREKTGAAAEPLR